MKTPHWFTHNRLVSRLRIAGAVTLLSAATAIAFVAVNPSGPLFLAKSDSKSSNDKLRQNRAALFRNKLTIPGPAREGGPTAAAEEEYATRAYPAAYVPFELTRKAQRAWTNVQAMSRVGAPNSVGPWTLVGPSSANNPNVLTFSGAPYTTSGRITAFALAPNCSQSHCTLYLAAAGGGIWKTDRALNTSPSADVEFHLEQFRHQCNRNIGYRRDRSNRQHALRWDRRT